MQQVYRYIILGIYNNIIYKNDDLARNSMSTWPTLTRVANCVIMMRNNDSNDSLTTVLIDSLKISQFQRCNPTMSNKKTTDL